MWIECWLDVARALLPLHQRHQIKISGARSFLSFFKKGPSSRRWTKIAKGGKDGETIARETQSGGCQSLSDFRIRSCATKTCGQKFFVKVFSDIQVLGPSRAGSFVFHRVNSWTLIGGCWGMLARAARGGWRKRSKLFVDTQYNVSLRWVRIYIHHDHQTPKGPTYRIQPLQLPPYVYIRSIAIVYKIMTRRPLMMGCRSGNNRARIIWYGPVAEGYLQ